MLENGVYEKCLMRFEGQDFLEAVRFLSGHLLRGFLFLVLGS